MQFSKLGLTKPQAQVNVFQQGQTGYKICGGRGYSIDLCREILKSVNFMDNVQSGTQNYGNAYNRN